MALGKNSNLVLGGKSAFSWRQFGWSLPFIFLEPPIAENAFSLTWSFWRWILASMLSTIPMIIVFGLGDFYFFGNRDKKPAKDWMIFGYGFVIGAAFGATLGFLTYILKIQNENFALEIVERGMSYGLIGALLLPFGSLLVNALEVYNSDREALIAERLLVESQKAESRAVVESLRSSLSHKVDANLLEIIENSKEYFNTKSRSLEDNWELLAERLRHAALETIRPFSHSLHRRGEEINYRVRLNELASYIAYKFDIKIWLTLFVYLVTTHHSLVTFEEGPKQFQIVGIKLGTLLVLLCFMKVIGQLRIFHRLYGFLALLFLNSFAFVWISNKIMDSYLFHLPSANSSILDGFLLAVLIVLISLGLAFLSGGHAEIEFLERRISEEQLEAMLLRREEGRISRELAKYLHGTIQSRLMASAIGLESAGKRGDVKALQKEAKTAYKNLKLPSEKYFSAPELTLKAELDKVIAKWKDLMKLKLTLPKAQLHLAPNLVQDIGNAVNEGLSNAFRHGVADEVNINFQVKGSKLMIEIEDNGTGPTKGSSGLGSEWFNAIAGSDWELVENKKSGATLKLGIPLH